MQNLTNEGHNQIAYQQSRIDRLESRANQRAAAGKNTTGIQRRIDGAQNTIDGLKSMLGEISELAMSKQEYNVVTNKSFSNNISGTTNFNFKTGAVEIAFNGNSSSLAHELKHGTQFENGQFSVGPKLPDGSNLLYDKYDEVEAYNRGALFGGTTYTVNNLPSLYNNLSTDPVDAVKHPNIGSNLSSPKVLQNIANYTGHAFRINKATYYKPR